MNEFVLRGLLERVKRREVRIMEVQEPIQLGFSLQQLGAFLDAEPLIKGILADLSNRYPQCKGQANSIIDHTGNETYFPKGFAYGPTDSQNAATQHFILKFLIERFDSDNARLIATLRVSQVAIKSVIIQPIFDYIAEQLDYKNMIVGELVRYKIRCECFNRAELHKEVDKLFKAKGKDNKQAKVEVCLKGDLYRYLHDQGIEFVIEPYRAKGEIDLILDQPESTRKYLEVKVFDDANRGIGHVRDGFNQITAYQNQYNAQFGYLVIYQICKKPVVVEGDEIMSGSVKALHHGNKTVYLMVIDLYPHKDSVSQRGPYNPITITKEMLIKQ